MAASGRGDIEVRSVELYERNLAIPSLLNVLFLLAVLFPYIKVVPMGTDVQPVSLCIAVVILLFSQQWMRAPRPIWMLGVLFLIATGVFCCGEMDFAALRSLGNYASLFLIALASFSCGLRIRALMEPMLIFAIWMWFVVGLTQSLIAPEFLYVILPDVRRTAERGVVSLAAEPGYYATMSLFFLFVLFLYGRERSIHGLLCVVQITLLARSTLMTGILLAIAFIYGIVQLNVRKTLTVAAILISGWLLATQTDYFENTRIAELTRLAVATPSRLTKLDLSISDRVAQLAFSLKGAFENFLIPNGFNSWGEYYHDQTLSAREYFLYYFPEPFPTRIQSGIGAPLYELGVFGFIPIWVLLAGVKKRFGSLHSRPAIVFASAIGLSLLPGTPIATPIYGFIVGQLFVVRRPGASRGSALRS